MNKPKLPVAVLLTANAISMVGNVLTMLVVPWFVLETTGSAARTGITGFFSVLGSVIAILFGGPIVDRFPFKQMSVASDLASGLAVALIPLLYYTTGLAFWQLLILVFFRAFLTAPGGTARLSMLPDLASQAGMRLERANSVYQATGQFASLAGGPLAGLLIALISPSRLLWIDAATFAFSALLIGLAVEPVPRPRFTKSSYRSDMREGLTFLRRDRFLRSIVLLLTIANFLGAPFIAVILPVYANQVLRSATALGLIVAGASAGSLAGTLAYGAVGHRLPRRATFITTFFAAGMPILVLATLPSLPVAVATEFVAGLVSAPISPLILTVVQELVPAELRGRVFGVLGGITNAAMPLGILVSGYLVEGLGLSLCFLLIAICYLAIATSQIFNRQLHHMSPPPPVPQIQAT